MTMEDKEKTIPINVDVPESVYYKLKGLTKLSKRSLKKEALMAIERWVLGAEDAIEPPTGQRNRDIPPGVIKKNEDDLKHMPLIR